jgi:hypothetical protein
MQDPVRKYLAAIGSRGGIVSRRKLGFEEARKMVRIREARRAYRRFHAQCFWSYDPDLEITGKDVPWVADQLRKHGGREAWRIGTKLCR